MSEIPTPFLPQPSWAHQKAEQRTLLQQQRKNCVDRETRGNSERYPGGSEHREDPAEKSLDGAPTCLPQAAGKVHSFRAVTGIMKRKPEALPALSFQLLSFPWGHYWGLDRANDAWAWSQGLRQHVSCNMCNAEYPVPSPTHI